jgi:hypothetical protein
MVHICIKPPHSKLFMSTYYILYTIHTHIHIYIHTHIHIYINTHTHSKLFMADEALDLKADLLEVRRTSLMFGRKQ